jgi:hypothetical protein
VHSWVNVQTFSLDAAVNMEFLPRLQSVHCVLASVSEYLPAPHSLHSPLPVTCLYLPAGHASNGPPFGPLYPLLAIQAVLIELPAGEFEFGTQDVQTVTVVAANAVEYVPELQSLHAALPITALYFPATHAEQVLAPDVLVGSATIGAE